MAIKLNLGSGDQRIGDFINIDLYDETADVKADICQLPYEDNSVDEAVALQVIEHVPYNRSLEMFLEWRRVLKPGGQVIVETPDIDVVCRKILEEGLQEKWIYNLVGQYYRPHDKERYKDWEMNAASIHRNPWNFKRLKDTAELAGFAVERQGFEMYMSKFEENLRCRLIKLL